MTFKSLRDGNDSGILSVRISSHPFADRRGETRPEHVCKPGNGKDSISAFIAACLASIEVAKCVFEL